MKLLTIVIIFLVIGGFMIARSYNLNLKEPTHRRTFFGKFSVWLVQLGKNTIKLSIEQLGISLIAQVHKSTVRQLA